MKNKNEHSGILKGIYSQLKLLFDSSDQGIYIYVDDTHKICNKKFAVMLGYKDAQEWSNVKENFPTTFVMPKSQRALITAFQNGMSKGIGSSFPVEWKKKSGSAVKTNVILAPIIFEDHIIALHFVSKAK